MKTRVLSCFLLILCVTNFNNINAKIKLPSIIGDNMVVQQNSTLKIWGWSDAGNKVKVKASWSSESFKASCDTNGRWEVWIPTSKGSNIAHAIEINDGDKHTINNVLIGEVWLCGGQSNMEMPVKGFKGQPVFGSHNAIVGADKEQPIRMFTVKRDYSLSPKCELEGSWLEHEPLHVGNFSATAYFFAQQLQEVLDIPVGVIASSWSASKIEPWMDKATLEGFEETNWSMLEGEIKSPTQTPTVLFNAMIHPLKDVDIKGVIWYQGESNSANPELYSRLFEAWVGQWRQFFNDPQMPVYYTEIAPYRSHDKNAENLPLFRESQLKSMHSIPNVGMAFTSDLGNEKCIHGPHKKQVGKRLAYWALAQTYQIQGIACCGPVYNKYVKKENKIQVYFDHAENGLYPENELLKGFEIAGVDGEFVPAQAEILGGSSRVTIWNDSIPEPREVRYSFKNFVISNLSNTEGLPAAPFRLVIE
ncbi:sialate O-acetylesterase [Carboxylicivirga taeanensis]|uniref:sialate O-acetylesterase n=1 Tax=Carboxylicivirga taeanensis TaxID=1416875 RepID=UPI003F6DE7F7